MQKISQAITSILVLLCIRKICLNFLPIQIFKKILDVLFFAAWLVVGDEGVFPHVESKNRHASDELAELMVFNKSVQKAQSFRIVVQNCPADAAGQGNGFKSIKPGVKRSPFFS